MEHKTHTPLKEMLKQPNLRKTAQRQAIYDYLTASCEHPSAEDIYQTLKPQHPTLSLATVYNTLSLLVDAGLVTPLGTISDNKTQYDANLHPHLHLYCAKCKTFMDFNSPLLEDMKAYVIEQSDFDIINSRHIYYGICPKCQPTSAQAEDNSTTHHKEN